MQNGLRTLLISAALAGSGGAAAAFETSEPRSFEPFGNCRVQSQVDVNLKGAYTALYARSQYYLSEGRYFNVGGRVDTRYPTITASVIADCLGVSPAAIKNLQQNGADGTFEDDDYIGFRFRIADNATGLPAGFVAGGTYEYSVGTGSLGASVADTQEEIAGFMLDRGVNILAAQPDLIGLLSGTATGAFNVDATRANGMFNFETMGSRPVWAQLQGNWSESGDAKNSYFFGAAGAHYAVNPYLLIGAMVEFDTLRRDNGENATEGNGYLVGPYFVAKLPEQPLYFEGRYLMGQTDNTVTMGDEDGQDFKTDRTLASLKVAGQLEYGDLVLTPSLSASHLEDVQGAFTDNAGHDVNKQSITVQDVALGLDFAQPVAVDSGELVITGGFSAIWSKTEGTGFAETVTANFEGERARVHLGTTYTMNNGAILSATTNYDGIGTDDFESFGLTLGLEMKF